MVNAKSRLMTRQKATTDSVLEVTISAERV